MVPGAQAVFVSLAHLVPGPGPATNTRITFSRSTVNTIFAKWQEQEGYNKKSQSPIDSCSNNTAEYNMTKTSHRRQLKTGTLNLIISKTIFTKRPSPQHTQKRKKDICSVLSILAFKVDQRRKKDRKNDDGRKRKRTKTKQIKEQKNKLNLPQT